MKRINTFDLLRGLAILVMVIVHRIYWDYYRQNAGALNTLSAGLFVFTLIATMAGIFFCISGAVNGFVNFTRLKEGKLTSKQVLLKSFITGLILIIISVLFRYFLIRTTDEIVSIIPGTDTIQYWNETGALPYMILYGEYPSKFFVLNLFKMGTLSMIGYSIIAVSIVLVLYNKIKGLDNPQGLRRLFLILGIVIFLLSGLTYRFLFTPITQAFNNGNIAVAIFLAPLFIGFSAIPLLSYGFFGAYFGIAFAQKDSIPKKVLRSMLLFWTILISIGIVILAVCLSLGIFNTWYYAWGEKLFQLGLFFFLFWLGMKFIDYQPEETREKRMKWLNPLVMIGRVTLTVYILEGVVAVSLQRIISPVWVGWNASAGNATLFGLINLAVWFVIIILWKQVKFRGSVEWTSAWLVQKLSGQKSSKLDKIQTQPVVDKVKDSDGG
jgi:surface polysaccharide O-acyltransferase-like enzyme